jgi:hypothetical protein
MRWQADITAFDHARNDAGRLGRGAVTHCAHGSWSSRLTYLDWRPFDYVTNQMEVTKRSLDAAPGNITTFSLQPLDGGGTRLRLHLRVTHRGIASRAKMMLLKPLFRRVLGADMERLREQLRDRDIPG